MRTGPRLRLQGLGVTGTLLSPLLGQRTAARAKEQEFELQRRQRQDKREEERRKSQFEERRSIYAKLNTSARRYQQALEAYAHAIEEGAVTDEARAEFRQREAGVSRCVLGCADDHAERGLGFGHVDQCEPGKGLWDDHAAGCR